jgi:hypothetical protein
VARAFGLNDNLIHDWRRSRSGAGIGKTPGTVLLESPPEFVALSLPPVPAPRRLPLRIQIPALPTVHADTVDGRPAEAAGEWLAVAALGWTSLNIYAWSL